MQFTPYLYELNFTDLQDVAVVCRDDCEIDTRRGLWSVDVLTYDRIFYNKADR